MERADGVIIASHRGGCRVSTRHASQSASLSSCGSCARGIGDGCVRFENCKVIAAGLDCQLGCTQECKVLRAFHPRIAITPKVDPEDVFVELRLFITTAGAHWLIAGGTTYVECRSYDCQRQMSHGCFLMFVNDASSSRKPPLRTPSFHGWCIPYLFTGL